MTHPAEEAASHAASHINKVGLTVSWAGNLVGYLTVHQAELQTLAVVLTILYTAWQFGRDVLRDRRDRAMQGKLVAWARGQGMRTKPAQLSPEASYSTSPSIFSSEQNQPLSSNSPKARRSTGIWPWFSTTLPQRVLF
jgi:hypothetical protein